jgi:30S ribosomal protein S31
MGKGDKKTRRGKIYRGTYGKARPKRRPGQRKARGARTPAATGPGARGSAGGAPGATRAR